jgi:hypothetical protein
MALPLAGVYAAVTYYHLHRDEIEADIQANAEDVVISALGSRHAA